jgi:RNA polymerase sigma-70 factor (ECF subfamily)
MNNENSLFIEYLHTGNRQVFEELFRMSKPWIYKLIYRIVPDKDIADDIFQETWIQVLNNRDSYDTKKGMFNNYLFTIAKNKALKAKLRASKFIKDNQNNENHEASYGLNELTPYKATEIKEKNDLIMSIIKTLDTDYQDVILLHYFADFDVKEISLHLNKPEGTIKTWLSRGREQLKKKLQKSNSVYLMNVYMLLIALLNLYIQHSQFHGQQS